jgi:hypothetical protein
MSHTPDRQTSRGSAILLAVFVLVLVTGTGLALLFMTRTESKMGAADQYSKKAFYMAEAGLEDGRTTLFNANGKDDFSDDLLAAAGGTANDIDFDATIVSSVYDSAGAFAGFTGYSDDVPLRAATQFDDGWYAAFLTNDYTEGRNTTTDTNQRVMLTGIGIVPGKSEEIVEAVIRKRTLFPGVPPATITMVGPNPAFYSGNSNTKQYIGDDCAGGTPGLYVPSVGVIGSSAELAAEAGMETNPDFMSGTYTSTDTIADLSDPTEPTNNVPLDPSWTDCESLEGFIEDAAEIADNVCTGSLACSPSTPCGACDPSLMTPTSVTIVDGDYRVTGNLHGRGLLIVTGTAELGGNIDWDGLIFVVGTGDYRVNGSGNGVISGGMFLANIAGPDGIYGSKCSGNNTRCFASADCPAGQTCQKSTDNCTGGTDGFGQATYDERGGGNSGTVYCSNTLDDSNPAKPYQIISFLQK